MRTIISVFAVCLTFLIPLLFNCGSTTEVSDESKIVGHLYTSGGSEPARDANVILRSRDYLSPSYKTGINASKEKIVPCSTFTDASGEYEFDVGSSFPAGTYIIEASDKKGNCAVVDSIDVNNSFVESKSELAVPEGTLKPGSTISGKISNNYVNGEMVVCIFGLDRYTKVNEDGTFTFDNVPEGKLSLYMEEISSGEPYSDTVGVNTISSKTVSVETTIAASMRYALKTEVSGSGEINVPDSVYKGEIDTIRAVASAKWYFQRWNIASGTAIIADPFLSTTTIILNDGPAVIQAVFSTYRYALTVETTEGGEASGPDSLYQGVIGNISAIPNADWYFIKWTVSSGFAVFGDSTKPATSIIINDADTKVKAVFSTTPPIENDVKKFVLKIDATENGTVSGADSVVKGVSHPVSAVPNENWDFFRWRIINGTAVIADSAAAKTTVTLNDGDAEIQAFFTPSIVGKLKQFELVISITGNGKVNGLPGSTDSVAQGDSYPVTAVASADWYFVGWKVISGKAVIADSTAASTTVILDDADAAVQAVFSASSKKVKLTVTSTGNCEYTGSDSVEKGTNYQISAFPNTNWYFIAWRVISGNAVFADSTAAITTVTLNNGDAAIQAVISSTPREYAQKFALRIDTVGSGTVSGADSMEMGVSYPITATPKADWYFIGWKIVKGVAKIADTTAAATTVTLVDGGATIQAVFSTTPVNNNAQMFNLMLTVAGGGGELSGPATVQKGVSATIKAYPNAGKYFTKWKLVEGTAIIADSTSAITTVILNDGGAQIDAVFNSSPAL